MVVRPHDRKIGASKLVIDKGAFEDDFPDAFGVATETKPRFYSAASPVIIVDALR